MLKDIFFFEKEKNDLMLGILKKCSRNDVIRASEIDDQKNSNQMNNLKARKLIEDLLKENNIFEAKKYTLKENMKRRKVDLKKSNKFNGLMHQAVLKSATRSLKRKVLQSGNKSDALTNNQYSEVTSVLNDIVFSFGKAEENNNLNQMSKMDESYNQSEEFEDVDPYEEDHVYLNLKVEYEDLTSKVDQNKKVIKETSQNLVQFERELSLLEAEEKQIKISQSKLARQISEYYFIILSHGIDVREDGLVWIMSEIKELGDELKEDDLPKFLDPDTKDFLIEKYAIYYQMKKLEKINDFYVTFFKHMTEFNGEIAAGMKEHLMKKEYYNYDALIQNIEETNLIARGNSRAAIESNYRSMINSDVTFDEDQDNPEDDINLDIYQRELRSQKALASETNNKATDNTESIKIEPLGQQKAKLYPSNTMMLNENAISQFSFDSKQVSMLKQSKSFAVGDKISLRRFSNKPIKVTKPQIINNDNILESIYVEPQEIILKSTDIMSFNGFQSMKLPSGENLNNTTTLIQDPNVKMAHRKSNSSVNQIKTGEIQSTSKDTKYLMNGYNSINSEQIFVQDSSNTNTYPSSPKFEFENNNSTLDKIIESNKDSNI